MIRSLIARDPELRVDSIVQLAEIADAIEREAVERYGDLAEEMARRGEPEIERTFRDLETEERSHVDMIADWVRQLGEETGVRPAYNWHLPEELGSSWDEALTSSLLTPYRALAIAVRNEERAFAFYSYIAARTEDRHVAREAERLAAEELRHATQLRRRRRRAYHAEIRDREAPTIGEAESLIEFAALADRAEAEAAAELGALANRARERSEHLSAFINGLASLECGGQRNMRLSGTGNITARPDADAEQVLRATVAVLERLSEFYETAIERAKSDDILNEAQRRLTETVERLALVGAQIEAAANPKHSSSASEI